MTWYSEKKKLLITITLLLATGFIITSFTSFFISRKSLRSEISLNELPLTSDNIYSEIQKDLLRPIFISSLMASNTFLKDWVIGGEVVEQQITKYLKEIKTKYNTITSFFVSDKTMNYYHTDGILKKVSPNENRDIWYYRVKDMRDDYEINVDLDLANKDAMTIFVNYRVFDYDNNYIGATGVGLTVSKVKKLIDTYQQKYNRNIYFIDKNGGIKLSGAGFGNSIRNISQLEYYAQFENNFSMKPESSFTYKKDGNVIHTNIRYIEEFDWFLVVEQPEREAIKKIFSTLLINLVICLFITNIVLVLINISVTAYQKRIETLRGIVPICSFCKQIRDDKGYWNRVELFVEKHTEAKFSHSICPPCMEEHYPEEYKSIEIDRKNGKI
ncbi:MAG: cache domain-containing protein [Desulfobacterales bacterium]|nr:cache domain-containing protein [Desulfobacteraceae bacterium]MBT4365770.1 cache domain-containing protein [Desulfobacteraceae bacterium]MBT7698486.1 cache domain-containing protein [Desulfobacterales bacterium]